jgi:acyl-ACP thioesterase
MCWRGCCRTGDRVVSEAPERLKWADEAQVVDSRPARPSDLDPNRHVNNTRYGDWISDVVAVRLGIDMPLRAVSINYLSEVRLGEQVRIAVAGGDGALTVQGSVETGETPRRAFVSRVRA